MHRRSGGGPSAVRRRGRLAARAWPAGDARAHESFDQRRVRALGRRLRHAAHADDGPQPALLRRLARGLRLRQGEGPARLREPQRPDARAHRARGHGDRGAQEHHAAAVEREAFQAGGRARQGALQSGVGEKLGVRSPHRRRNRPPGQAAQADRRARPGVLRGTAGRGDRIRRRASRSQRRPQAQPLGAPVWIAEGPLVCAQDSSLPHPPARHREGVPHERGGRPDVPLDLDQGRDPRLPLGRGGLDPRGQRPHGERRPAARLQSVQDVPDLRQAAVRAFVTGGTGFVGAHLVRALRARGDAVTGLVRPPAKAQGLGWTDVRLVRGDLDDARALRDGCAGADVIYHVAGRISARDLPGFMRANRDGTANLLEAATEQPPRRLVLVSSLAAAGPTRPGEPIEETRPPSPVTPDGQSKLAAEGLVRAIGRSVGREPRVVPLPALLVRGLLWAIGSVAHLAGRATLLSSDKAAEFLAPAWTCRPDALMRDTGWRAEVDLATGLRRTAEWYRTEGWL